MTPMSPQALPRIDVHMHLAGTGCCNSGCWITPRFRTRWSFRMLRLLYGITEEKMHRDVDAVWVSLIHKLLVASPVDYGVVLGFDGVFDPQQGTLIAEDSQLIVPHQWVFKVCRDYPNLLPGPSINPFRGDALTILDECIEEGAVLIKWLPSAQGIDASAGQLSPFYKRLAQSGIPLLVHIGSERTFAEIQPGLNELRRLVPALEMGVIVIAAHSATPILMSRERDQVPELHEMLQRFPKLYVDNSGLNNPGRFRNVKRLVKDELIVARTLYGSDWPIPSNALYYAREWGLREVVRLEKIANLIARDVAIKERAGYPQETLTRANHVLANLDRWIK